MDLLIGFDVGTTAAKANLFDLHGRVVASATQPYGLITPRPGWVEQDPEAFWEAAVSALRTVAGQIGPDDRVLALGQSSQGGTTIPLDEAGRPTYNALSWMDGRAEAERDRVAASFGAEALHRITGWPLMPTMPIMHIAWLRRAHPEAFARTRRFTFVNDYIGWRLTGERCMNPSDASVTQLFDIARGDWDDRLLGLAGVERGQLSPLARSGTVVGRLVPAAADATGLPAGTLVANGAHDQYCAALGAGVTRPGPVLLSCGTAWLIVAVPATLEMALASRLAVSCHAVAGRWGALYSLGAEGTSLEWLADHVYGGRGSAEARERAYAAINEGAAHAAPGASGLLFFPLAGTHGEIYGTGRGGFVNLTLSHGRDDMARAAMEAVAFELRWALEDIREAGLTASEFRMVGGAARSPVWPQIVADVSRVPVVLPPITQAASWGAAVLAGVAAGVFSDPEMGAAAARQEERRLEPAAGCGETYAAAFEQYRRWRPLMARGTPDE